MGITNAITSTNHRLSEWTEGALQPEHFRNAPVYVSDHQRDCGSYSPALIYAYNLVVHRSTCCTAFQLILKRPSPEFAIIRSDRITQTTQDKRHESTRRTEETPALARINLERTQALHERDLSLIHI